MVNAEGSPARTRNVVAILVRVYSILFLIATLSSAISLVCVNDLLRSAAHVDGQVIDITRDAKGRRAPVVRFKTVNGQVFQAKSSMYTSPAPDVGDVVKVVYRISDPRDWQIDDWLHVYFWTLMSSIFMFAWAMAVIMTKLFGSYHRKKLERA